MRINVPQRPGQDPSAAARQQWRWLYQLTEQLNMVLEQLEGRGVLDLQSDAAVDSVTAQGSGADPAKVSELEQRQQAADAAMKALEDASGGNVIRVGSGSIAYGSATTAANIAFGVEFAAPPTVLVSQVFDDKNLFVQNNAISTTGCVVGLPGGFSSSGTRAFRWAAIGPKKEG